jgi:thiol:disulfide interchange protein DsbD
LAATLVVGGASALPAAQRSHVTATLLSEQAWIAPGRPLTLAVRLEMDPGWHTYWENPGDSGLPTRIQWELPAGLAAGPILWPAPERFGQGPVVSYGYSGDVLLMSRVTVSSKVVPGETLTIRARIRWLECREECRSGRTELALQLPVRRDPPPSDGSSERFARARRDLPAPPKGWTLQAHATSDGYRLTLRPPGKVSIERAYFYPSERALINHAAPQTLTGKGGARTLVLAPDRNRQQPPQRLTGVLVTEGPTGVRAVEVDLPLAGAGG